MANYFATTGDDIVSGTNSANGTNANDSIYLQNDITLTSGQVPNLNSPSTAGTLRFRGGTPANYPATGDAANPINYRLTVVDSLNISDTSPSTAQPSFTIGPLTLQIGNGTTAGGIAGNIRVDDGGVLEFNRSVDTTYTGTVSVEDEGNAILNSVAGTTVTLTGGSGNPGGTAIRASQNTGAADSFELTLGGAGNGVVSGTIVDQNTATNSGALIKTGSGTWTLTGANTYAGGTTLSGGNLVLGNANAAGTGDITFSTLSGNATARLTLDTAAQANGVTFGNTIANFNGSSELDLKGLTNASVSFNSSNSLLTVTGTRGGDSFTQSFTLESPTSTAYEARDDGNGGTVVVVCFAAGTRIRTTRGDVPVETLAVGERAVTASGEARPIRWIGHRTMPCRGRSDVMPVRIAAGTFGERRPFRDLLVSPAHAICVDPMGDRSGEVLIPAIRLLNGSTITQVEAETVSYWHVELDSHDILIADGLPTESYLDCGNRRFFANAEVTDITLPPDARPMGALPFCRPFHESGPVVETVRERLDARARALGWQVVEETFAGLHLVADGRTIRPETAGLTARFVLPAWAREVRLVSAASVPAHVRPDTRDVRRLGVPLAGLTIDGTRTIAIADPRLEAGFHPVGRDGQGRSWRWTDGSAVLPASLWAGCPGPVTLEVRLSGPALPRWVGPSERTVPAALRLHA